MSDETYNGWKNYPTWCVNLWLNNDQGTQEWALEIVRDALNNDSAHKRYDVSSELKHAVREMVEGDEDASLGSDLLGYALDCVDWYEIADGLIESIGEEEDC